MPYTPAITVLLAVHNDLSYLPAAVESVLAQEFSDFEAILIDDGSSDGCGEYLDGLRDPRVRVLHNDRNLGLTASFNRGLDAARGRYIARMDADDICEPQRLGRQVEFLEANAYVGIVGSSRTLIDEAGKTVGVARATEGDLAIRWKCLLGNPFAHPTVMLRRSVLQQHGLRYESYRAEDYELWARMLQYTRGENLAEPLLRYRLRGGYSRTNRSEQLATHDQIAHAACRRILPQFPLSLDDVRQLRGRYGGFSVREADMNPADEPWVTTYSRMLDAFVAKHGDDPRMRAIVHSQVSLMRATA